MELLAQYETYLRTELRRSDNTISNYVQDLKQWSAFMQSRFSLAISDKVDDLAAVTYRMLRRYIVELADLKRNSILRKLASIRSFFNFGYRRGWIKNNPAKALLSKKRERRLPVSVPVLPLNELLDNYNWQADFAGLRDRALLELLYGCGLRRSEAAGLRTTDIDFGGRTLRVTGKGAKMRIVPFGYPAAVALQNWINHRNDMISETDAVFIRRNGMPLRPAVIYHIVRKWLSQIPGLARYSPHVLRHSFATHLVEKGAPLNAVKELLGHSQLISTEIYLHNSVSRLKSIHQRAHPRA
jgi:integrase/recombinase XerC